jgi:hypothetical protein
MSPLQLPRLLLIMLLLPSSLFAQKHFMEGNIVYKVTIDPGNNLEGITQYTGTYTIALKGTHIRKELKMNNGFSNIMLNTGTAMYALRNVGSKNIAIEVDKQQHEEKNKKYKDYKIDKRDEHKTIINLPAEKVVINYTDGNSTDVYLTKDWEIDDFIFDRFPAIKMLPLIFDYKNDDGTIMHFTIQKIEQKNIENTVFAIPSDYKIMTSEEYKKLNN